jgi:hypothetical protein
VFSQEDNQAISMLSKELATVLVSLVPVVGPLQGLLTTTASLLIDRTLRRSEASSFETMVQRVSDQVSKQISKDLKGEFRSQPEGATISALYDLRDTLSGAELSVASLIQTRLDPLLLERELLKNQPSEMRMASEERRSIYFRAVRLCSEYIIAAVPELPGFQLALSQALLQQQDEIMKYCQDILNKLK